MKLDTSNSIELAISEVSSLVEQHPTASFPRVPNPLMRPDPIQ